MGAQFCGALPSSAQGTVRCQESNSGPHTCQDCALALYVTTLLLQFSVLFRVTSILWCWGTVASSVLWTLCLEVELEYPTSQPWNLFLPLFVTCERAPHMQCSVYLLYTPPTPTVFVLPPGVPASAQQSPPTMGLWGPFLLPGDKKSS